MEEVNQSDQDPDKLDSGMVEERPTLKTLSRLTGLAVPTISRALNDAPDIGEDTKRRVKEIAARIGYRPNRAGVRLRTGRTNVISLVLSTEADLMNHSGSLISSIAATLRGTPYHLIVTPFFPSEDPMAPIRYIVETGSADGILLNQIETQDPRVRYLMERDFPFATHGRTEWCDQHAYYDFDNTAFGRISVEALHQRGRRNIAMLPPPLAQNYARNMIEGAKTSAAGLGVRFRVITEANADSGDPEIEAMIRRVAASGDMPDGFIVPSAAASMTMISELDTAGLRIGRDYELISKSYTRFLHHFRRDILTMGEDVGRAGEYIARAVLHRIAHRGEPPMQELEVPQVPISIKGDRG